VPFNLSIMPIKHLIFAGLTAASLLTGSCKHNQTELKLASEEKDSGLIITCSGYSMMEQEGQSEISAPVSGRIISVLAEIGKEIRAGQHVAVIENADFIVVQQEYLEARNLLDYYSQEYARQGDLTVENATSMKRMQSAKRDYQSAELKYKSLQKQLSVMGLNPDSLKAEDISALLPVKTIRSGMVSGIHIQHGSYVEKGEKLFDLVRKQSIIVKLLVPEDSYMQVHKGQKVDFRLVADSSILIRATVLSVSDVIDPASHTATIFARPMETDTRIIPGMSVNATIYTVDQKE